MRLSKTVGVLSLVSMQVAEAFNNAIARKFSDLAEMGLLPDGTPMGETPSSEIAASFRIAAANRPPPPPNESIVAEYVELPLDNFAKNGDFKYYGTFNNRFWVRESAYKPGGPVFLYDGGEANAEPNALFRLTNETSFFKQLVDKYNGIGIMWEHRYYGNSTPEPINLNTPPEAFKFLNTAQALADVDRFAKQFKRKSIKQDLRPKSTPWIFVGGSYPAMRAVFMRDKYPDTIFASYASSAPTEARVDMSVYFEPVWRGLNAYGFGNCSRDIQATVRYIDKVFDKGNKDTSAKLIESFLGLGAGKNSPATFADALTTITATWQSYGVDGGKNGLRNFCDYLETDPETNKTAPAEGWAASKGAKWTTARWASNPTFTAMTNLYLETECSGSLKTEGNCDLNRKFTDPTFISWTWQYCTEWGFFQSANLGPNQLISKYNSLAHQKDICHRQFPTANLKEHGFPEWPNTERTNRQFGGWDVRPSQVYWSGGEFDPWRTLSPQSGEKGIGAPFPRLFTNPPRCGEEQDEDELFGYVLKGAQHCYDFRTTFAGGAISRQYFTTALDRWLKCFKPKKG